MGASFEPDPELVSAVNWLRSFVPANEWEKRRDSVLHGMAEEAKNPRWIRDPSDILRVSDDTAAIILLTGELGELPAGGGWYDPMTGARYIPLLTSIGRRINRISAINGIDERAARMMLADRAQADATLFEVILALAYDEQGWRDVQFLAETKRTRLPDFTARRGSKTWSVEAKRMAAGQYREKERDAFRRLFEPAAALIEARRRYCVLDIAFHVDVHEVPSAWLVDNVEAALRIGGMPRHQTDCVGEIRVRAILSRELDSFLSHDYVLFGDAQFVRLALGSYDWRLNHLVSGIYEPHREWPRYVDRLGSALLIARWRCASSGAIEARSRHIKRHVADAASQLLDDIPGAVHVGLEALDGDSTEMLREGKSYEAMWSFNPRGKPLAWVYCHVFRSLVPPDGGWTFDETTSYWRQRPYRLAHPLRSRSIVRPPAAEIRPGGHWLYPIDQADDDAGPPLK